MVGKTLTKRKKEQVYVAMPLKLKNENHRNIVDIMKKKIILEYPELSDCFFFNPFEKIKQDTSSDKIMSLCFKVITDLKTKAVVYILPLPVVIDKTFTLGAISECYCALKQKKPVYVYLLKIKNFKNRGGRIIPINHLDELMKRFNLKAPCWWFKIRERDTGLNISKQYKAKKKCTFCICPCEDFIYTKTKG